MTKTRKDSRTLAPINRDPEVIVSEERKPSSIGVSIGTLTFPMVRATAADAFGRRSLYLGFAMICFSIGLFAVCVLGADPGERGLNPDGVLRRGIIS
jgi:hypothetical protein